MQTFKCLEGLAPVPLLLVTGYLVAFCTKGSPVSLRFAVRGDLVVSIYRTDWGLRAFFAAGPSG